MRDLGVRAREMSAPGRRRSVSAAASDCEQRLVERDDPSASESVTTDAPEGSASAMIAADYNFVA